MRSIIKPVLLIIFVLGLVLPGQALATAASPNKSRLPDQFVFGDNYTLSSGNTLDGNLWVFGGNATLEQGSHVTGNVRLMGGSVHVDGEVDGNVAATGGLVDLGSNAVIHGNIDVMGASLSRANGARVDGQINTEPRGPFQFTVPSGPQPPISGIEVSMNPFWELLSLLFRAFLTAALAVLAVMFWPRRVERVAQTIISQPVISGGMGLLTAVVGPIVLVLMMITLILMPVSLIGFLLLALTVVFGWIALGLEIGQRIAQAFNKVWAMPVAAGVGTFALTLLADGISRYVACIGWLVPAVIGVIGLGAVVLSRYGTQLYPGYGIIPPAPPSEYAPVVPYEPAPPVVPEPPAAPESAAPEEGADTTPPPPDAPL